MQTTKLTRLWLMAPLVMLGLVAPCSSLASGEEGSAGRRAAGSRVWWTAQQLARALGTSAAAPVEDSTAEPFESDTATEDEWHPHEVAASDEEGGTESDTVVHDEGGPAETDDGWDDADHSGEMGDVDESGEAAGPEHEGIAHGEEAAGTDERGSDWVEGAKSILDGLDKILKK